MKYDSKHGVVHSILAGAWRDLSAWQAYALALAVAICFLAYLFPWAMFQGNSIIFDFGDNAQHTSGWWYYAKDTWHFPLLHTSRVDHPEGVSIAFTDSIPLAALFFKALMTVFPSWFPAHFHYFGWWIGFVFITQALSATLLMRALGAKSIFATVLVLLFVLTWPVIHVRYSHAALMLHSILLLGLALYFLGVQQQWRSSTVSAAFIVLHVVSLLVHPYFLPFIFGLYMSFMADIALKNGQWLRQLIRLFVLLTLLLAVAMMMGYFGRSTFRGGYGDYFHFNIASPFCASLSKLNPCDYGHPAIPTFEGFNYFGLGLILLLPIAIALYWRDIVAFPKRYPALLFMLVSLFLYALTNHVWVGRYEVFNFPLPSWTIFLTGAFRAAGRFFWLIGYLLLITTLVALVQTRLKGKNWPTVVLLVAALVIQVKDVKPWLTHIKTEAEKPSTLNYAEWQTLMTQVDKIVIYPTFDCGQGDLQYYTWIMQLAGYYGKLLNSGYTARDKKDCQASEKAIQEPLQMRHLYVVSSYTYYDNIFTDSFTFPMPLQSAIAKGECIKRREGLRGNLLCLPGSNPAYWNSLPFNTEPAIFTNKSVVLSGTELHTHIGVPDFVGFNAPMVPKDVNRPGWLSLGPELLLPIGKYQYAVSYVSKESHSAHVGHWTLGVRHPQSDAIQTIKSGNLFGSHGDVRRIEGTFEIAAGQETMLFELRTFFLAQGELKLRGISLAKLP